MTSVLPIPTSFGSPQASEWFGAWREVREMEDLHLSLPADAFVRPAGIVLLASGIAWRRSRGMSTWLEAENPESDAYRYLQRIDFFSELGVHRQEGFRRHDPTGRFVPLKRIVDMRTARSLADQAADVLEEKLPGVGPSPLRMARFIFEELGANIVQHSQSPETGFGMAQADSQARRIEIAFADSGVGFLRSLLQNPELAGRIEEDAEALQLAIGRAVSSREPGRGNMGMGLALLVSFADVIGGDLRIASGSAVLHRRSSVGTERTTLVRSIPTWDGSWICLEAELP